jgi:hypothetical protein
VDLSRPFFWLSGPSKTACCTAAKPGPNITLWKYKIRPAVRMLFERQNLLHEYSKNLSIMVIISHWLRENQARLCLLLAARSTVWKPFPFLWMQ